ncbi:MAG: PAS domain-containing protein [Chloroflexi bacterium]|nr:MAG: PAS domain-containing protein [Chloroflexota bacterium]
MIAADDKEFETLLEYLRDTRGFDFTGYKRNSLARRVSRRSGELGLENFTSYLDYLQVHPEEFGILFDKILINVTDFFRDRPAWDYVAANVVPKLLAGKGDIRIWSTGTASGEEAYSAAILLCQALGPESFLRRVKIYATDIDEAALNKARAGYSAKELKSLDDETRARYFEPQGGRFAFRAALRRAVIFGKHDLMQDAPISRLDLLICRNTLMYFTAEAQGRILARFHYALNDEGYLFLGRAEMLLTHTSVFVPVDVKQRIFHKVPRPPIRERRLLLNQSGKKEAAAPVAREARLDDMAAELAPYAQIVVDSAGRLVLANQQARRALGIDAKAVGRLLKDLEMSYKPVDLRSPLDKVYRDRSTVTLQGVPHQAEDESVQYLDVAFVPLLDADGVVAGVGVSFVDVTQVMQLRTELDRSRQELDTAYEELQSSNEELETTNEELQSTVEELETTNEELQSSNEELETMNEELESTNVELQSINLDLQQRTDEVDRLNTFLLAITGNMPLGAVVLDPELNVRVWNEKAADLWGLRSDEVVGRSFLDLGIGLPAKEVGGMIRGVLLAKQGQDESVVEAVTRRGTPIRCRVAAYAISDGSGPGGVVLVMEELAAEPESATTS